MTAAIDLDAYLQRIGHAGALAPDLDTLRAIVLRHAQTIAFENLDPFLHRPVLLDAQSLQRKLVRGGRGGYCFEQNLLLDRALRALGYRTTGLAARVLWTRPDDAITARSHMLLRVDLDGEPHLVDVGFGGLTLTGVLRLVPDIEQPTPHEVLRLLRDDGSWRMQACVRDEWKTLYRFDLQRQYLPDYELTSWYLSNHPDSHFVTGLVAARADGSRRYALRGIEFAVHHLDGHSERRTLSDAAELRHVLEQTFRLKLPSDPDPDSALQRLFQGQGNSAEAGKVAGDQSAQPSPRGDANGA